jgi:hypothetical protein
MKTALNNQLKKIKKQAQEQGVEIKIQESTDVAEIVMIGCPDTQKVVMLVVDQLSYSAKVELRAFTINLKKWNWAETEGFTEADLLGTLSDQVFKEIEMSEILEKLS